MSGAWAKWGVLLSVLGCGTAEPPAASPTCADRREAIAQLESTLFEGGATDVSGTVRKELLKAYGEFANACNGEPETPEMLFRRADLLRSVGAFEEAMTQLRDVHDHFPQYPHRARCAFLVGFIAESELGDREQARLTYQQVVDVHPESEEAEWARMSLEQLDLRGEELLRTFRHEPEANRH